MYIKKPWVCRVPGWFHWWSLWLLILRSWIQAPRWARAYLEKANNHEFAPISSIPFNTMGLFQPQPFPCLTLFPISEKPGSHYPQCIFIVTDSPCMRSLFTPHYHLLSWPCRSLWSQMPHGKGGEPINKREGKGREKDLEEGGKQVDFLEFEDISKWEPIHCGVTEAPLSGLVCAWTSSKRTCVLVI